MALICDTGPLFAAFDADDPDHFRCARLLLDADVDLVVPALVLAEVDYRRAAEPSEGVGYIPLAEATRGMRSVPLDCDEILTAREIGINFGDQMPV